MTLVGIDEVGRGCWAGPLVAAAVVLKQPIPGLKDSKKLSKLQREKLAGLVENQALAIGLGWVWPQAIDSGGISQAVKTAMTEALQMIQTDYNEVIIDGNINYLANVVNFRGPSSEISEIKIAAVVRADDSVPAVSAASIVAKVARDRYMADAAEMYPGYGFERHVGYGTAEHLASLRLLGITDIHRRSYKPIKQFIVDSL